MSLIAGEKLNFGQADGTEIRLVVHGDEHYARYEKEDGYTVVYDGARQVFCYSDVVGGRFVSTGVPALQGPPPGIRRHLHESSAVRVERSRARRARGGASFAAGPGEVSRTFGPSGGLLAGRRLSVGSVKGLTILVHFADVTSTVTRNDVDALLNADDYDRNGNVCSAREYFRRVSNGKLDYSNVVVGPYRLSRPRQFYVENLLVKEAVDLAVADGLDLRQFDSLNQGIVDALNVLYAGQTQYLGDLWPHNHHIGLQYGAVRTDLYLLASMGRTADELSIGTFCHENGHLLCRFPDMYDFGSRDGDDVQSEGIGAFCLMGSGNHNANGRAPSPVCGYLRELAGWCDDVVLLDRPGEFQARQGDYGTVVKFPTVHPNEYFVVENRTRMGLDVGLPASGLAVYHCDTLGSNEHQDGTSDRHYQCALLQADGRRDLERNVNRGDGSDLFAATPGVAVSSETNPSTRLWDGSDSGLVLAEVGAPGESIAFRVGAEEPAVETVRGQAAPNAPIPDDNASGVSSKIQIAPVGSARRLAVAVDVSHTWIGDLVVEVVAPSGRTATLHNRTGGNRHDLVATFTSEDHAALATLVGEPISGPWTLRVLDREAQDTGKLNKWSLEIGVETPVEALRADATPNQKIPDDAHAGIASVLAFSHAGLARRVRATVEIQHSWIGDLRVELVSPAGRSAVLHAQTGGSKRDLSTTFDSDTPASPLATLVGQSITGNWTLRVSDRAARDVGTLKKWSLALLPG